MIKIRELSVDLGGKSILENINATIPNNKTTVILGKSGAGKSVLLKTIERFFYPISGSIECDGKAIFDLSEKEMKEMRKNFGYLFQHGALLDSMTVYQNLALPLFEHTKMSELEILEKVKTNLDLVSLGNTIDKYPSELSGGMQKRVSLARAIMLKPKYIFYDEPTTGLDPITGQEIIDLMKKLSDQLRITSVIITHDLECVKQLAAHVIMIDDKTVLYEGDYANFHKHEHEMIQSFLRNG